MKLRVFCAPYRNRVTSTLRKGFAMAQVRGTADAPFHERGTKYAHAFAFVIGFAVLLGIVFFLGLMAAFALDILTVTATTDSFDAQSVTTVATDILRIIFSWPVIVLLVVLVHTGLFLGLLQRLTGFTLKGPGGVSGTFLLTQSRQQIAHNVATYDEQKAQWRKLDTAPLRSNLDELVKNLERYDALKRE
jgi:uncharacterized membrane protein